MLWKATVYIEFDIVVEAANKQDAEWQIARHAEDEFSNFTFDELMVIRGACPIWKFADVPADWRDSAVWGRDDERTCREILGAEK